MEMEIQSSLAEGNLQYEMQEGYTLAGDTTLPQGWLKIADCEVEVQDPGTPEYPNFLTAIHGGGFNADGNMSGVFQNNIVRYSGPSPSPGANAPMNAFGTGRVNGFTIQNNYTMSMGISVVMDTYSHTNVLIANNYFLNCSDRAMTFGGGSPDPAEQPQHWERITIRDNVITLLAGGIDFRGNTKDITLANNSIHSLPVPRPRHGVSE